MIVLNWEIANSGPDFGSVGWGLRESGWSGFIDQHVEPALEWCAESGVTPAILIHHPFGMYASEDMAIDGWDYAQAADAKWLTNNFATKEGWHRLTKRVDCFAYLGGVDLTPRLRDLPPAELGATIRRNLKPLKLAGFRGVYIDYAENAISHPFSHPSSPAYARRSLDTLVLEIADSIFAERTGIESTPRAFRQFQPLFDRPVVLKDSQYRHRYDPAVRHKEFQALGYDRSVLTGKVWRTLPYSDTVKETIAAARAISAEGDVPCVSPQPLVRAGVKAGELLERGKE